MHFARGALAVCLQSFETKLHIVDMHLFHWITMMRCLNIIKMNTYTNFQLYRLALPYIGQMAKINNIINNRQNIYSCSCSHY